MQSYRRLFPSIFLSTLISLLSFKEITSYTVSNPSIAFHQTKLSTTAPPKEKTTRRTATPKEAPFDFGSKTKQRRKGEEYLSFLWKRGGPIEYLADDESVSRKPDDPFHILLLGATFDKPKITLHYVTGSLNYVLGMPEDEAGDHSKFAEEHGMSCLGTWTHEECVKLGDQLLVRDIVCRVVPFCEGNSNPWQAKRISGDSSEPLDAWN